MALTAIARIGATAAAAGTVLYILANPTSAPVTASEGTPSPPAFVYKKLPTRKEQIHRLRETEQFDVLIIGGGAIACGIAVDAAARGLSTALVDIGDFGYGASTRGTKLLPATPRGYQEPLVPFHMKLFRGNTTVIEERSAMFHNAPHLCYRVPLMIPVYDWKKALFMWIYFKTHWYVFRDPPLSRTQWVNKFQAVQTFPLLKKENLRGGIIIHDAMIDDIRMNITLVITAARLGATAVNHVGVCQFLKDKDDRTIGVVVRDQLTGSMWPVNAKCVVNATGHNADTLRSMESTASQPITNNILSTYIVLPRYFGHSNTGFILKKPRDSSEGIILSMPFRIGSLIAGWHRKLEPTDSRAPKVKDISGLLGQWNEATDNTLAAAHISEVLAAWNTVTSVQVSGFGREKPVIDVSPGGMVSIAGGSWTDYRRLSQEVVDTVIANYPELSPKAPCTTKTLQLEGAAGWSPTLYIELVQKHGLEADVARHLTDFYGDHSHQIALWAANAWKGKSTPYPGERLVPGLPYIETEVRHAVHHEYAMTAIDVLARRLGVAFADAHAAERMLPRVVEIMAAELGWSRKVRQLQYQMALKFLEEDMGLLVCRPHRHKLVIELDYDEVTRLVQLFSFLDKGRSGFVSLQTLRPYILQERFHPDSVLAMVSRQLLGITIADDPATHIRSNYYIPELYRPSVQGGSTKGIEIYGERVWELSKTGSLNPKTLAVILDEMKHATSGSMELGDFLYFMNNLKASLRRQQLVLKRRAAIEALRPSTKSLEPTDE